MSPVGLEDQELFWQRHFAVPSSGGGGSAVDLLPPPGRSLSVQGKGKKLPRIGFVPSMHSEKPLAGPLWRKKMRIKERMGNISQQDRSALTGHRILPGIQNQRQPQPHPCQLQKVLGFHQPPQRLLFHWRTPNLLIKTRKPQPEFEGKTSGLPQLWHLDPNNPFPVEFSGISFYPGLGGSQEFLELMAPGAGALWITEFLQGFPPDEAKSRISSGIKAAEQVLIGNEDS